MSGSADTGKSLSLRPRSALAFSRMLPWGTLSALLCGHSAHSVSTWPSRPVTSRKKYDMSYKYNYRHNLTFSSSRV